MGKKAKKPSAGPVEISEVVHMVVWQVFVVCASSLFTVRLFSRHAVGCFGYRWLQGGGHEMLWQEGIQQGH